MKVLKESHSSPTTGHVGFFKTYYNARQSFYWKEMNKDIQKFVAECNTCQRNKNENVMTPGLLHLLHIPDQKWEEISMDFIEGLPMSDGKDKIFVVVDRINQICTFHGSKENRLNKTNCKCLLQQHLSIAWFFECYCR
jgi:hypothetical protein